MQLIDSLLKPYTEEQKTDFIFKYQYDYKIKETETTLEAWGYTEEEKEEQEAERISHLTMTKRVCALMLQQLGIPYSTLKEAIASSEQAQLEWDLCVELERCNPFIDVIGATFGLSSEQIDQMFKYANGEADSLEVE